MGRFIDLGQGSGRAALAIFLACGAVGFGLFGLLAAGLWPSGFGGAPPGLLVGLAAGIVALIALLRVRRLHIQLEKMSGDLDAMASQLLALRAAEAAISPRPDRPPSPALAEVTGELSVLGGLVHDLAVTVAAHDEILARAEAKAETKPETRSEAGLKPEIRPAEPEARPAAPRALAPKPAEIAPRPARAEPPVQPSPPPVAPERSEPPALDTTDARRLVAILEAFKADQIEIHLQPIVTLPQRKVRLYEALARLRLADGDRLVPAEFLGVLERAGLAPSLDRKVLARAAAIVRHLAGRGSDAVICCNLSPLSIAEPGFLRALGRLLDGYPDLANRLVLELSQGCWRSLDAERAGVIAALREKGLAFSLDRATDLRLDPTALADRGLRYLKLPAEMLLRAAGAGSRSPDIAVGDLAAVLARAGISLVAERVEREEDVPDLIDLDVPLAQGFALARPRAVRPDVLTPALAPAPAAEEPPAAPETAPPAEPAPQRLPFRAFLRRAG